MVKTNFFENAPDFDKLKAFGFVGTAEGLEYSAEIAGEQFSVRVIVRGDGVYTETCDLSTGEEYTLHHVAEASGEFVGRVREEYFSLLRSLKPCFPLSPFSGTAVDILEYAHEKYGDEPEFLWDDLDAAVLRRKDTRKWYAVLMKIQKCKLGLGEGYIDIVDVRYNTELLPSKVDGARFFLGYHMNKKHWLTAVLDGSVSKSELFSLIDWSYSAAK